MTTKRGGVIGPTMGATYHSTPGFNVPPSFTSGTGPNTGPNPNPNLSTNPGPNPGTDIFFPPKKRSIKKTPPKKKKKNIQTGRQRRYGQPCI